LKVDRPGSVTDQDGDAAAEDTSSLASVVLIDRREEIAGVCGRVDTAPTFAVVIHAPKGNRQLSTELGMRRLRRHVEESGKVVAIATTNSALSARARLVGIPVARKPEHVRWDSGGRRVLRLFGRTLRAPVMGRYAQVGLLFALTAVFLGLAVTAAPAATLTVYPATETLSRVITITASPDTNDIDFVHLKVPARKVSAKQHITLAMRTTGTVSVGTKPAKVTVSITNPTGSEVVVPERAVLSAGADALLFELDAAVTVPAGKTVTAVATATQPGIGGNVPAGTLTVWSDAKFKVLAVTNPAPAAGGVNENRLGVDAKDLVAIKALAQDLQKSDSVKSLLLAARPHDAVFLRTAETSVDFAEPPTPAGTQADLLLLDVDVTVSAYAVLESTLDAVAKQVLRADQGTGEFIRGTVSAIETGARQVDAESGAIRTEIQVQGEFVRNFSVEKLKDAVKGQSPAEAKSTLKRIYGIQDADVSVSPGWAPWLPRFSFRIGVDLRNRAAEDAAAAKVAIPNDQPRTSTPAAASPTARP
jgi:spore coat protein U-like protein